MNDPVLEGFIHDFSRKHGFNLEKAGLPTVFESFVAYSVLRKYHQCDVVDIADEVLVSGANDGGIDALAVLVNGVVVRDVVDFDALIHKTRNSQVDFVFVQSKTSSNFSASEIGNFSFGISQFFSHNPQVELNEDAVALGSSATTSSGT